MNIQEILLSLSPALIILSAIALLLLIKPLQKALVLVIRCVISIFAFSVLNALSTSTGIAIGVNFLTIATSTLLGFPGFCAAALCSVILG